MLGTPEWNSVPLFIKIDCGYCVFLAPKHVQGLSLLIMHKKIPKNQAHLTQERTGVMTSNFDQPLSVW